jgi:prepilin signal peptidase PulO-like enzyme (type II secretory pathway)
MLPILVLTLAAGLAIGSFLNVVAWRLPAASRS